MIEFSYFHPSFSFNRLTWPLTFWAVESTKPDVPALNAAPPVHFDNFAHASSDGWGGWSRTSNLPGNNRMRCQLRYTPSVIEGDGKRRCVRDLRVFHEVILVILFNLLGLRGALRLYLWCRV